MTAAEREGAAADPAREAAADSLEDADAVDLLEATDDAVADF
eukprot:CAMPEP_0183718566 /NCGR_PEP_ID=MMETSP0737-20130205/11792_1 /TAXON_ID=385413 /ORGANISM="Thalassiosira miniscula, Strain CCMP1093" /LENGTH=41 /DNA_ID= /DNA_START= /DNA_END= /DNA_ORIENTATION=